MESLDKVTGTCLSLLLVFFLFLFSRDCESFCNFKSLLYRVRFECVSLLLCIHLFFPTVKNILTICHQYLGVIEVVRELNSRNFEPKAWFVKDGWWMGIFFLINE